MWAETKTILPVRTKGTKAATGGSSLGRAMVRVFSLSYTDIWGSLFFILHGWGKEKAGSSLSLGVASTAPGSDVWPRCNEGIRRCEEIDVCSSHSRRIR